MLAPFFKLHPENTFQWNVDSLALTRVYRSTRARFEVVRRKNVGSSTGNARRMRANAREILDSTEDPSAMLADSTNTLPKLSRLLGLVQTASSSFPNHGSKSLRCFPRRSRNFGMVGTVTYSNVK